MSSLADAIDELCKEVEDARRELEGKENALRVLQGMHAKETGSSQLKKVPVMAPNELIDLSGVLETKQTHRLKFVDSVRDVVSRFGDQEFSVVHTEFALKKMGIELPGKTSRSRISMALNKLVDEGVTVIKSKGSGNVPNRYRLKNATKTQEEDESL